MSNHDPYKGLIHHNLIKRRFSEHKLKSLICSLQLSPSVSAAKRIDEALYYPRNSIMKSLNQQVCNLERNKPDVVALLSPPIEPLPQDLVMEIVSQLDIRTGGHLFTSLLNLVAIQPKSIKNVTQYHFYPKKVPNPTPFQMKGMKSDAITTKWREIENALLDGPMKHTTTQQVIEAEHLRRVILANIESLDCPTTAQSQLSSQTPVQFTPFLSQRNLPRDISVKSSKPPNKMIESASDQLPPAATRGYLSSMKQWVISSQSKDKLLIQMGAVKSMSSSLVNLSIEEDGIMNIEKILNERFATNITFPKLEKLKICIAEPTSLLKTNSLVKVITSKFTCPNLIELDLSHNKLSSKNNNNLSLLCEWMKKMPNLQRLNLSHNCFTSADILSLSQSPILSQLTHLDLSQTPKLSTCNFAKDNEFATLFGSPKWSNGKLVELKLDWQSGFGDKALVALSNSSWFRNINVLTMYGCSVESIGAKALCNSIYLSKLVQLSVGTTAVDNTDAQPLKKIFFSSNFNNLESLTLGTIPKCSFQFKDFPNASFLCRLKHLGITQRSTEGNELLTFVNDLFATPQWCPKLTALELSMGRQMTNKNITEYGSKPLALQITSLSLADNECLTNEAVENLSSHDTNFKNLIELDISGNPMISSPNSLYSSCGQLQSLYVHDTKISQFENNRMTSMKGIVYLRPLPSLYADDSDYWDDSSDYWDDSDHYWGHPNHYWGHPNHYWGHSNLWGDSSDSDDYWDDGF